VLCTFVVFLNAILQIFRVSAATNITVRCTSQKRKIDRFVFQIRFYKYFSAAAHNIMMEGFYFSNLFLQIFRSAAAQEMIDCFVFQIRFYKYFAALLLRK
jgi:hypothetical protein